MTILGERCNVKTTFILSLCKYINQVAVCMIIKIILVIVGLAYAISPFDFIPDFFVGLGWIDDIAVLILLWKLYQYIINRRYGNSSHYTRNSFRGDNGQQAKGEIDKKDPYEVLGVRMSASSDEIKHAYKLLAAKYHPDKVVHLGEEFRELADQRFKEIQEAYQKLRVK